jgi:NAD(P)H dehydrogenase (quinone)
MNIFIIVANERASSFNAALKNAAVQVFRERGDDIQVSDLYAMGFKAVADKQDYSSLPDPDCPYQVAQNKASEIDLLRPDIKAEIDKLLWADLIIFHFPFWWFSMPAILKGWIDRVIINGPLYSKGRWYSNGVLKGKKAFITLTTGAPETAYCKTGINGYIINLLFPIQHGIIHFLGMDALDPFIVYSSSYISEKERKEKLDEYKEKLFCIEKASLTSPPNVELYDQGTWKIKS